jgi:anthranilate synthase component 1
MQAVPDFHVFNAGYEASSPQLVRRTLVGDLETPVSAFLKLTAESGRNAFLLESVERFAVDIR